MKKDTTAENETENPVPAFANRFGIPIWTGKDIKEFRRIFAPPRKKKMSLDDLAKLIGFNHRSQAKRLEDQAEISPSMSITLEYVKRLLTEERNGYEVDWKLRRRQGGNERRTVVSRQDEFIRVDVTHGEAEDVQIVVKLSFIKPLDLEIKNVENGGDTPLYQLRLE